MECYSTVVFLLFFRLSFRFVIKSWIFYINLCEISINDSINQINITLKTKKGVDKSAKPGGSFR